MAEAIGGGEVAMQARAEHAHRIHLQPSALRLRRDDRDVGSVRFVETLAERARDHRRGEVLVLGEDVAPGGGDRVEVQQAHFVDGRMPVQRGLGARDGDGHVAERGRDGLRPAPVDGLVDGDPGAPTGGAQPAFTGKRAERAAHSPSTTAPTSWNGP